MRLLIFVLSLQILTAPDPAQMEDAPDLGYRAVPHGLQIPAGLEMGSPSSVDWTPANTLLVFNRGPHPLMEFNPDGSFVRSWGGGAYVRPHRMRVDAAGNIWTTDVSGHTVTKMNSEGDVLMTLGEREQAGAWNVGESSGRLTEPTDLAIGLDGEIFVLVSHGRGEPRLLKFDRGGTLLASWGGRGDAPGEFDIPHSIVVDTAGRVYVADRENRRVQVFDGDGRFIEERKYEGLPCGLYIADDGQTYLTSGFAGEILKLDESGRAIGATGQPGTALGEFGEAHYMTMAPNGDIYVADTVRPALHRYVKQ